WISNEISRQYVHEIRHRVAGIMVGIGTVIQDDPSLTTRLKDKKGGKGRDSSRIIVDTRARIPLEAKVLNLDSDAKTIIATTELASKSKIQALKEKGAEIIITPIKDREVDLSYLMKELGKMNIDSVLLEGGSTLNYSALEEGIVDKVISFISPKIIGGTGAKTPVGGEGKHSIKNAIMLENIKVSRFEEDIVIEGYIKGKVV
ncbi:MAG: RibD family protein, partial [Clostridium sp.]|nr:RibD family protein [Clostridium sp.]